MKLNLKTKLGALAFAVVGSMINQASAVPTISNATTVLSSSLAPVLNVSEFKKRSYDPKAGNILNTWSNLQNYLSPMYAMVPFMGSFSAALIGEQSGYQDKNIFGVVRGNGSFNPIIPGSATPSSSTFYTFSGNNDESLLLALNVPFEGGTLTLTSESRPLSYAPINGDASFSINAPTILGQKFTQDIDFILPNGQIFNAFANNLFLGFEDLTKGDLDYNDMFLVIRDNSAPIPEPATMTFLLGAAGIGALKRRRATK